MYKRKPIVKADDSINQTPFREKPAQKFELLWRKKSRKMHKTWEGDAVGIVSKSGGEYTMSVTSNGQHLGKAKLGPQISSIEEGSILNAGPVEVEVGQAIVIHASSTRQSPNISTPGPVKKFKLQSQPFLVPLKNKSGHREQALSEETLKFVSPLKKVPAGSVSNNTSMQPKGNVDKGSQNSDKIVSPVRKPSPKKAIRSFSTPTTTFKPPLSVQTKTQNTGSVDLIPNLRPHQNEAVEFMKACVLGRRHRYGNGCILADEMGLGKTLTSIALIHNLLSEKHIRNALIVCPVSLITNWKLEFKKWLPPTTNIGILSIDKNGLGNGSLKDPAMSFFNDPKFRAHQVLIVGYERVRGFSSQLSQAGRQFDLVICDEGHRLKSAGSQTSEALNSISGDKRIILTGTPIQNHLIEFWALSEFVNPGILYSEAKFTRKFAEPIDFLISREKDAENATNSADYTSSQEYEEVKQSERNSCAIERAEDALSELTEVCDEIMLRRTSEVIQKYISVPRHEHVVFVRPTKLQLARYATIVDQAQELCATDSGFNQQASLQMINELRKISAGNMAEPGGKLHLLSCILDELSQTNEKIVIVSGSTRVLDICQSMLASKRLQWLRLDGRTPQEKRTSSVRIFNNTESNSSFAFLLSSRSGGVGLNLIGGSRLVLLDCDWNPAIDTQAMARIHRDGQKKPCHIYRLITTGTIEEKIFQRQLCKIGLSKNVLLDTMQVSGVSKSDFSKESLRDLFTLSVPNKCTTLDNGAIAHYREDYNLNDEILLHAMRRAQNVSCVLTSDSF